MGSGEPGLLERLILRSCLLVPERRPEETTFLIDREGVICVRDDSAQVCVMESVPPTEDGICKEGVPQGADGIPYPDELDGSFIRHRICPAEQRCFFFPRMSGR